MGADTGDTKPRHLPRVEVKHGKLAGGQRCASTRHKHHVHLAQAQSNTGRRGRKRDFPDAERLVRPLVAQELTLSFVPDAEQRLWRTVTRRKYQLTRNRVQVHNRLEALLEEAHLKLSSLVSDALWPRPLGRRFPQRTVPLRRAAVQETVIKRYG